MNGLECSDMVHQLRKRWPDIEAGEWQPALALVPLREARIVVDGMVGADVDVFRVEHARLFPPFKLAPVECAVGMDRVAWLRDVMAKVRAS